MNGYKKYPWDELQEHRRKAKIENAEIEQLKTELSALKKDARLLDELLDGHDCDCGETGETGIFLCYLCEVKAVADRIIAATNSER